MKLFFATRFGHDESEEGSDGPDTHFIVRALDRDQAVEIVDFHLSNNLHHKKVEPLCHRITAFGTDSSKNSETGIIYGPWYDHRYPELKGYITWMREAQTKYKWEDQEKWFSHGTAQKAD